MTQAANATDRVEVRSSRLWAFLTANFTRFLFPAHMYADHLGISTYIVYFWLTPWRRSDEHLPMSHLAEVMHNRGFFWDSISVESSGGANPLVIGGLPKSPARKFVAVVRERMNEAPAAAPPPPAR